MNTRRRRLIIGGAVVLGALVVAGGVIAGSAERQTAQQTATEVAAPLANLCATDRLAVERAGGNCEQAAQVVADGAVRAMQSGRGITGTTIVEGRLVVSYSDGSSSVVGTVVGAQGAPGVPGTPAAPPVPGEDGVAGADGLAGVDGLDGAEGRGITGTTITGGRLVVSYTDGTTGDLGVVVGPAGRGVVSLDGRTGRLMVTLTDGEVVDAGPLPQGPRGDTGAKGDPGQPAPVVQSVTRTYADGTVESCTRSGGTDTDPTFDCTTTAAPDPTPDTVTVEPSPEDPAPTTEGSG